MSSKYGTLQIRLENFFVIFPAISYCRGVGEDRGVYAIMQEMLGNLHLPEIPHDGADSEDSDDEQDPNWQWKQTWK